MQAYWPESAALLVHERTKETYLIKKYDHQCSKILVRVWHVLWDSSQQWRNYPSVANPTLHTLLRIIKNFNRNEYFRTSYSVGTAAALRDHIQNKLWTLRNKFLRLLCININRRKRNNFLFLQEANGGKHSYHYCHPKKRCPGSFIQCIYNYCHLQKKCPLHHPWKNLSGFKTRLIAVYFHVGMSFEITLIATIYFALNYGMPRVPL